MSDSNEVPVVWRKDGDRFAVILVLNAEVDSNEVFEALVRTQCYADVVRSACLTGEGVMICYERLAKPTMMSFIREAISALGLTPVHSDALVAA
ncbi:hypothetical protein KC930_02865 [Candidatus Saccharibacteria bacterium]|nr:hypothetical protein [Candidatus Saccharibacteria bacterium]